MTGEHTWAMSCYDADESQITWLNSWSSEGPLRMSRELFLESLHTAQKEQSVDRVVTVGHSYGGWTALALAVDAIKLETNPIIDIITLDPISLKTCKLGEAVSSFIGSGVVSPGCTEAPRDLPVDLLRDHPNVTWLNYYQTAEPLLRSGPAAGATKNSQITYTSGSPLEFAAHGAFPHDQRLAEDALKQL